MIIFLFFVIGGAGSYKGSPIEPWGGSGYDAACLIMHPSGEWFLLRQPHEPWAHQAGSNRTALLCAPETLKLLAQKRTPTNSRPYPHMPRPRASITIAPIKILVVSQFEI